MIYERGAGHLRIRRRTLLTHLLACVVSPAVGDTPHKIGVTQAPLQGTFNFPNSQKVAREK